MRWIIEGTWSGYTSSQSRVVHRRVTSRKAQAEFWKKLHGITYTDGTSLFLSTRETKPREKVKELHGYDELVRDCERFQLSGWTSVMAIVAKKEELEAKRSEAGVMGATQAQTQ